MDNGKDFWCNGCEKVVVERSEEKPKRCPVCGHFDLHSHPPVRRAIVEAGKSPEIIIG